MTGDQLQLHGPFWEALNALQFCQATVRLWWLLILYQSFYKGYQQCVYQNVFEGRAPNKVLGGGGQVAS